MPETGPGSTPHTAVITGSSIRAGVNTEKWGRVIGYSAPPSRHATSADADLSKRVLFIRATCPEQTDTGQYQEQPNRDCRQNLGAGTGQPSRRLRLVRIFWIHRIGVERVDHVHHVVALGVIKGDVQGLARNADLICTRAERDLGSGSAAVLNFGDHT